MAWGHCMLKPRIEIVAAVMLGLLWVGSPTASTAGDVKILLIGSHAHGAADAITTQSFQIENFLHFNGLPYDFFDIYADSLDQSTLDLYPGVILEGNAMRWDATEEERELVAENMEAGTITALVGMIDGEFTELNDTIYGAMDVSVDGQGNSEHDVHLLSGARKLYDFWGDKGFALTGGPDGMHVAIAVHSIGEWMQITWVVSAYPTYGAELALETWLENAFGADARVTLPVISLRLDDTETTCSPRNQGVIDFMEANKHRIRASGYLVTDQSAYMGSDSLLQRDEQIISRWGTMSLHGKNHVSVGAEGANQGYAQQNAETGAAVSFLQNHFARYKPIKACPMNSWNEATLHALCANGIYYHTAEMSMSESYKALYKRLFDVDSEMDREKMDARRPGLLQYYPLAHTDETGEAKVYSVDWIYVLGSSVSAGDVLPTLRRFSLDWSVPMLVAAHFYNQGAGGSNSNPQGWIGAMSGLMDAVDAENYPWRRWVDNLEFAKNTERFDRGLTVNSISVDGDIITYDITAAQPIRFLTLRAGKDHHYVESVTVNGSDYVYFGNDYVHLPEIAGHAVVVVRLTSQHDIEPHVTHIDPSAVIENAQLVDGRLRLLLSGEFEVTASVSGSTRVFANASTQVSSYGTELVRVDASSQSELKQAGLSVEPSFGWVTVDVGAWAETGKRYRAWTETACPEPEGSGRVRGFDQMHVDHMVEDLEPDSCYVVKVEGTGVDTCISSSTGDLAFSYWGPWTPTSFEVILDSDYVGGGSAGNKITEPPVAPQGLSLQVSPNPFNARTTISYHLAEPSPVAVDLYSVEGLLVARVLDAHQPAGAHSCSWDGRDAAGGRVGPGLYLCRIQTSRGAATRKIVLFR
jgi:hypothetical protein